MNTNKTTLARVVLSLFAGMMFWSSWSMQAARHAAPQPQAFGRVTGMPEASKQAAEQRRKVEMSQRLSRVVADPSQIKKEDLEAVKAAFGPDSSKLLELLRQAQ